MTSYMTERQTCGHCGTESEHTTLASTNSFGSPDLDLRPPPMMRFTMEQWLLECPVCRFVGRNLAHCPEDAADVLESAAYRALLEDSDVPELARRFERLALLSAEDPASAGNALIRAAWVCDDAQAAEAATAYRLRAAEELLGLQPFDDDEDGAGLGCVSVDLLRRAGRFDEARRMAEELGQLEVIRNHDVIPAVLRFEARLCAEGDAGAHTISESSDETDGE